MRKNSNTGWYVYKCVVFLYEKRFKCWDINWDLNYLVLKYCSTYSAFALRLTAMFQPFMHRKYFKTCANCFYLTWMLYELLAPDEILTCAWQFVTSANFNARLWRSKWFFSHLEFFEIRSRFNFECVRASRSFVSLQIDSNVSCFRLKFHSISISDISDSH